MHDYEKNIFLQECTGILDCPTVCSKYAENIFSKYTALAKWKLQFPTNVLNDSDCPEWR